MVKVIKNPAVMRRARPRKPKTPNREATVRFPSPRSDDAGLEDCVGALAHTPSPKSVPPNPFSGSPKDMRTIRRFFRVVDLAAVTESCENFEDDQKKPSVDAIIDEPRRIIEKKIPIIERKTTDKKRRRNTAKDVAATNRKLTEFFPVRRSARKPKNIVQEERQRSLEKSILMKVQDGLEIRTFEGKGRGVVATRRFNRGDYVVEYRGELIDVNEARQREIEYARDRNAGCYMYYFKYRGDRYCVDATPDSGHLGRLVNHSRNGNLVTKTLFVAGAPRLVLIAKDDIEPGEEVTYDYGDRSRESLKHHPWLAF